MKRLFCALIIALIVMSAANAGVIVEIPLSQQINTGLGDAISVYDSFGKDGSAGYVERLLSVDNGAGNWYDGPVIDLVKAGYGPVDMSAPGTRIEYTARYFQGGGNANPYSDAPIFVTLVDADGHGCELGISYGPQPSPTYPAWLTVSAQVGTAPDFDASRVSRIIFYGTDWGGVGNDFIQLRNLRILDNSVLDPVPISALKGKNDNADVVTTGAVSASFPLLGSFYIQNPGGFCGIQVRSTNVPAVGPSVVVTGTVQTDSDTGEMYVQAADWRLSGSGDARVRFMKTTAVGGAQIQRQIGIDNPHGLNNIGLLVRVAGKLTSKAEDNSWAYISDGSPLTDNVGIGIRVSLAGIPFSQRPLLKIGNNVIVTGISSLYRDTSGLHRPMLMMRTGGLFDPQSNGNEPRTFRALVVNFDPFCPGHDNKRTHEVFGWNNPRVIANGYINDLATTSGGWCQYKIVDWFDADYHPDFEDGFRWNPDDYVHAWETQTGLHNGTSDYKRLVTDPSYPHNQPKTIAQRIADDEIDEVFFFGAPAGAAFWEASMIGPSPFFVNGGTYPVPEAKRNFVVMGFNYERGIDCMLEDFLHRTECVMSRVYPSPDWWFPTFPAQNNWDKFRMIDLKGTGSSAIGMCHFAPNSQSDYDWGNTRYVWSTCDDWYNWPNLQGEITKRLVNCTEWGNGDMRLHHVWWLDHFPKAQGINPDGRQNNWWKYTCDFNNYPESK